MSKRKKAAGGPPEPQERPLGGPGRFEASVALSSDLTGRTYQPGDVVTADDFPSDVLVHWAETGRVVVLDG